MTHPIANTGAGTTIAASQPTMPVIDGANPTKKVVGKSKTNARRDGGLSRYKNREKITKSLMEYARSGSYDELLNGMISSINSFEIDLDPSVVGMYVNHAITIILHSRNQTERNQALRLYFDIQHLVPPHEIIESMSLRQVAEETIKNLKEQLKKDGCHVSIDNFEFSRLLRSVDDSKPEYIDNIIKIAQDEVNARNNENIDFIKIGTFHRTLINLLQHEIEIIGNDIETVTTNDISLATKIDINLDKILQNLGKQENREKELEKIVGEARDLLKQDNVDAENLAAAVANYRGFISKIAERSSDQNYSRENALALDLLNAQFLNFLQRNNAAQEVQKEFSLQSLNIYRNHNYETSIPHMQMNAMQQSLLPRMLWIAYNYETELPEVDPERVFVTIEVEHKQTRQKKEITFRTANYQEFLDFPLHEYEVISRTGELGTNVETTLLREILLTQGRAEFDVALDKCRQKGSKGNKHESLEKKLRAQNPKFMSPEKLKEFARRDLELIESVQGTNPAANEMIIAQLAEVRENGGTPKLVVKDGKKSIQITYPDSPKESPEAEKTDLPQTKTEPENGQSRFYQIAAAGVTTLAAALTYWWRHRNPTDPVRAAQRGLQDDANEANSARDARIQENNERREEQRRQREQEAINQTLAEATAFNKRSEEIKAKLAVLKASVAEKRKALDTLKTKAKQPLSERYKYVYSYFNPADIDAKRNPQGIMKLSREAAIKPLNNFLTDFLSYENMLNELESYVIPDLTSKSIDVVTKKLESFEAAQFPNLKPVQDLVAAEKIAHDTRSLIIDRAKYKDIDTITDSYIKLSRPWYEMFGVDLSALRGEVKPAKVADKAVSSVPYSVGAASSVSIDQHGRMSRKPLPKPAPQSERKQRADRMKEYWVGQNPFVNSFCDNEAKLKNAVADYERGIIDGDLLILIANYHIMRMCGSLAEAALGHKNQNANSEEIIALDGDPLVKSEIILGTNKTECEKIAQAVNEIRHSCMHEFYDGNSEQMTYELSKNLIALFDPLRERIMQDCTTQIDRPITMPDLLAATDRLLPSRPYASLDPAQKKNMVRDQLDKIQKLVDVGELSVELNNYRNVAILRLAGIVGDIIKKDDTLKKMFQDREIVDNFIGVRDLTGHLFGFEPHEMGVLEDSRERLHYDHEYYDIVRDGVEVKPFAGRQRDRAKEVCPEPVHDEIYTFFAKNIDRIIKNFTEINISRPRAHARRPLNLQEMRRLKDTGFENEHM